MDNSSSLIFRSPGYFLRLEDDFLLAGQLLLHFLSDEAQVTGVGDKVQVVGRHGQDRTERKIVDPCLIQDVESIQVIKRYGPLIVAAAVRNALHQGGD